MVAELGSLKIRDAAVVQDHLVHDHAHDLVHDPVVGRARAQGIIVVLDPDQGLSGRRYVTYHFFLMWFLFFYRYFNFKLVIFFL